MDTILPLGTEVLIFNIKNMKEYEKEDYIKGKVIGYQETDNLLHHGSGWYELMYRILGDDGKTYLCLYKSSFNCLTCYYIATEEDYEKGLEFRIEMNNKKVKELTKEINKINEYNNILANEISKINKTKIKKLK